MIDYIIESASWNPYDHEDMVQKWMATNYIVRKEKGELKKDCMKGQVKSRFNGNPKPNRENIPVSGWWLSRESRFDDLVQVWDISMDQLEEAYITVAMKRHLMWTSAKTFEKPYLPCIPPFKRKVQAGSFMRRIFWLNVDDGNLSNLRALECTWYQLWY